MGKGSKLLGKAIMGGLKGVVKKAGKKAVRGGKALVKGAKIAKAAHQLTTRTLKGTPKMLYNAAKGRGMVLPGSKYIGPGNYMNKGKPRDKADAAAKQHDIDYGKMIKAGHKAKDVYLGYSDADKRLMKRADVTTPSGLAAYGGMKAKQLLNKTGLTKRIRDKKKVKGKG